MHKYCISSFSPVYFPTKRWRPEIVNVVKKIIERFIHHILFCSRVVKTNGRRVISWWQILDSYFWHYLILTFHPISSSIRRVLRITPSAAEIKGIEKSRSDSKINYFYNGVKLKKRADLVVKLQTKIVHLIGVKFKIEVFGTGVKLQKRYICLTCCQIKKNICLFISHKS